MQKTIETCIHEVMEVFYRPELGLIVENVSTSGELLDNFDGRLLNPGHAIEAMWFIMDLGVRLQRKELVEKAVQIALQEVEYGWDKTRRYFLFYGSSGTSGTTIGMGSEVMVGSHRNTDLYAERLSIDGIPRMPGLV